MVRKTSARWTYGFAAAVFLLAALLNLWMILKDGATAFRGTATAAFALGGILLCTAFCRAKKTNP